MSAYFKNVFAVLAHEHPISVWNFVRNLRACDAGSDIIVYDGSGRGVVQDSQIPWKSLDVEFIPRAVKLRWGELHDFAISSIEYLGNRNYDIITFLDSDQLLIRSGYSSFLQERIGSDFGVLTTEVCRHGPDAPLLAVRELHSEWYIWKKYLGRFPNAEEAFVRSTFWPGTVVSSSAARDIAREFRNSVFRQTLLESRAWATEECLIPTISYLLGYEEKLNPCDRRWCTFRTPWSVKNIEDALDAPEAFYVHPIKTDPDDPVRMFIHAKTDFLSR